MKNELWFGKVITTKSEDVSSVDSITLQFFVIANCVLHVFMPTTDHKHGLWMMLPVGFLCQLLDIFSPVY